MRRYKFLRKGEFYFENLNESKYVFVCLMYIILFFGVNVNSMYIIDQVELLLRVHHINLVSLVGYCDEKDHFALIYEYMSNGDLHQHLSGEHLV